MLTDNSSPDSYRSLSLSEMEGIVARFKERVEAAQLTSPANKEGVKNLIRRKTSGRCMVRLNRLSTDVIVRHGDGLADLFCEFPDDLVWAVPYDFALGYRALGGGNQISSVAALMQENEWVDEWGITWRHAADGVGPNPVGHPLKDWSQLDDYIQNKIPNPHEPGRLAGAMPTLALHGSRQYCVGAVNLVLYERLTAVRGMENTLADFYTNPDEIRRLCAALTDYAVGLVQEWGKTEVAGIYLTDDWGSQNALMVSPPMWRDFFKEHYRRIFAEIHRAGKDVLFHSCGNVFSIMPDLIEVGADVLDPLQPGPMDLNEIARRFGGKVSFSGGIDDQRLEEYTPQEVKDMVRRTIDTLGTPFGNSYIVSAANMILPSVPLENLQALFQASHAR
jgi:uroporphyrinogen decarboxylase